jgi:hypothetical protein
MKKKIFFLILVLFLFACKNEPKTNPSQIATNHHDESNTASDNTSFVKDTIVVRNLFDDKNFKNDTMMKLLDELDICNTDLNAAFDIHHPPCEPRFYKFYKFNKHLALNDAFALEIRAGVDQFPLRRFIVFKRINGKLVKLNGFVANLVEMQTTPSGYNDLLLLFRDNEAGSFVVKFTWNEKNALYQFNSLVAVDGGIVRKELVDSLSNVVNLRLENNHMFF